MSGPLERYALSRLMSPGALLRLGGIGCAICVIAIAFAWAGGWLSPGRLNQRHLIDTFEAINGPHPGFRRNHAKGVCVSGWFASNGQAVPVSKATVFEPGRTPVFGRLALAGGMPRAPDSPASVRSMALNFTMPDSEVWRTGMNDIPVFVVKDARGFYDQLMATKPDPKTGKPDPAAVKAFLAAHPETKRAMAIIKAHPFSSGFANARFNSLDAFRFINAEGVVTPVRWSMVPEDPYVAEPETKPAGMNYLFQTLTDRVHRGPLRWHLIVTVGKPGDPTNDATMAWPDDRRTIDAGILTIAAVQGEAAGNCRDINFDPLVLPAGIAPSDDPLLSARSAAYSVSFTRRAAEQKSPSAVQIGSGM